MAVTNPIYDTFIDDHEQKEREEKWESFLDDLKFTCESYGFELSPVNLEFQKNPLDWTVSRIATFKVRA